MYDRTGLSTKCTLIKTGFKNLHTGTEAKVQPFVDALIHFDVMTQVDTKNQISQPCLSEKAN